MSSELDARRLHHGGRQRAANQGGRQPASARARGSFRCASLLHPPHRRRGRQGCFFRPRLRRRSARCAAHLTPPSPLLTTSALPPRLPLCTRHHQFVGGPPAVQARQPHPRPPLPAHDRPGLLHTRLHWHAVLRLRQQPHRCKRVRAHSPATQEPPSPGALLLHHLLGLSDLLLPLLLLPDRHLGAAPLLLQRPARW